MNSFSACPASSYIQLQYSFCSRPEPGGMHDLTRMFNWTFLEELSIPTVFSVGGSTSTTIVVLVLHLQNDEMQPYPVLTPLIGPKGDMKGAHQRFSVGRLIKGQM